MELPEKELIGWLHGQLKSASKSQSDLCAAFQEKFGQAGDELVGFLVGSKYFRKTGVGDDATWMISANRRDDLRDYLAD